MENICTLKIGEYQLSIIYNKLEYGLYTFFSSDKRMKSYVENHLEQAFQDALNYEGNNTFILNIASIQNFGMFEWKGMKNLLNAQLSIFMPIIQKFIEEAITQNLTKYTATGECIDN